MKPQDVAFNDQIEFLLLQYRQGGVSSISDLMKLIEMAYGDYLDFYQGLPEVRYTNAEVKYGKSGKSGKSGAVQEES